MKTTLAALLAASALCAPALAYSSHWKVVEDKDMATLISERGDVAFRCVDDTLRFVVSLDGDVETKLVDAPRRSRVKSASMEIGAEDMGYHQMHHFASRNMIATGRKKTGRAMFNAAIRGESVSIEGAMKETVQIDWPTPDAAAFNDFKAACGL